MATLGIDLGGTKIALGVLEADRLVYEARVATPTEGAEAVLQVMIAAATEAIAESPAPVRAVGVGSPGPIDFERGVVLFAPNIAGFREVELAGRLREALELPVRIENDANAAALAEHRLGAARGARSSLFVTVSTGIGGGLVADGRVWRGAFGQAGEFGHLTVLPGGPVCGCGQQGCLEAVASGRAMARDASYAYAEPMGAPELFDRWRAGEAKAARIVEAAAVYLGQALADAQKLWDPEVIVLGGGVAVGGGKAWLERVELAFAAHTEGWRRAPLRPAELGERAGVIGAALAAQEA
ncbi:MAG TPA: ROK family protein [Oceanithermus profundus]|uniref:ROK family protein n=1 Tax=Oceanithermus profundus TaxID=187137 RepID=A0A7C4VCH8_9DEIN|nr:ROK family protein [Oceanithermus profundus]